MNRHRLRIKHLQDALGKVIDYHVQEYELTKAEVVGVLHVLAHNELVAGEEEDCDGTEDSEAARF